ncbi:hypothetical protein BDR26DRAFT_925094 [Obelidium mucronatum]|nr:hypothetical protein BDR26DRAFT_925094 [Obelidium mucronatum]
MISTNSGPSTLPQTATNPPLPTANAMDIENLSPRLSYDPLERPRSKDGRFGKSAKPIHALRKTQRRVCNSANRSNQLVRHSAVTPPTSVFSDPKSFGSYLTLSRQAGISNAKKPSPKVFAEKADSYLEKEECRERSKASKERILTSLYEVPLEETDVVEIIRKLWGLIKSDYSRKTMVAEFGIVLATAELQQLSLSDLQKS